MNSYRRTSRWAAALALGLAGLILGAATVHAAGTAASAFELTLEATLTPPLFSLPPEGGTFRSGAPFCASGRFVEPNEASWRLTCDDGTGSLTVMLQDGGWRVGDGSGSYAGLRGRGSLRGEQLCGGTCDVGRPIPWRGTFRGFVDRDAVAPTVAFTSATATKLPRPKGAYALKIGIALRDDVADNQVSYTVRACSYTVDACAGFHVELARRFGTATTEAVSLTLRIRPPAGTRWVQLQVTGEDPVGNAASLHRAVRLPR